MADFKSEIEKLILQLKKKSEHFSQAVLTELCAHINNAIVMNFGAMGRWDGNTSKIDLFSGGEMQWSPLAPSTLKAYQKKGWDTRRTLYRSSGNSMMKTTKAQPAGTNKIMIVSNKPYSAIQNYGGDIHISAHESSAKWKTKKLASGKFSYRFAKSKSKRSIERKFKVGAYNIRIPASPFITLTKSDIDLMVADISRYLFRS